MSSWVKVSRKLLTSAIASKPEYLAVWMHLILSASYKPGEILVGHQVVKLEAGQLVFGRLKFSQQIGVSEQVLRSALKALENLQQITIKSHSKYSIISITNWARYQDTQPTSNQQLTSNQPAVNHNKEIQELQEEKKDQKPLSSQSEDGQPKTAKRKTAKDVAEPPPYDWIMERYNSICGATFKRAAEMNPVRMKNIAKCWNRKVRGVAVFQSGKFWEAYFNWCLRTTHWAGEPGKSWRASLEFVTRPDKVDVIIDEMIVEGIFGDE